MSSVVYTKTLSMYFSSDTKTGASNIQQNGSVFSITLNSPLVIPRGALDVSLAVVSASIPYVNPNISPLLFNNEFKFTTTQAPAGSHTITMPKGLYSLEGLNSFLSNAFVNLGYPSNLFVLSGDNATQKTIITYLLAGDNIDFTIPNSVRSILGFDALVYTSPVPNYNQYSPNSASFNTDTEYVLSSTLVQTGIPINNQSYNIIGTVPITAPPGSIIVYQPSQLVWVDVMELCGNPKQNFLFRLTNQNLTPVDTLGDTYQLTIIIQYTLLLSTQELPMKP